MLVIRQLLLCYWFSCLVLPYFRAVLAISRVFRIKLKNTFKRKDVTGSRLKGIQRGGMAWYKTLTLEGVGIWKGRPWGPHTMASMKPVSLPLVSQLPGITLCETSPFFWFAGERKEKGLKEMSCQDFLGLFRGWIFQCSKELPRWKELRNIRMHERKKLLLILNILTTE